MDYFGANLPSPENHKIYFDYGTEGLDAYYEPYQNLMDEKMQEAGFFKKKNWMTKKFDGADHNEKSWRERLHIPFKFLLGKE